MHRHVRACARACRWHKLSPEKLGQIRVLQQLKARLETELGHALPTGAGRGARE